MATVFDLINGSYVTIFNRAADPQGALFWSQSLGFSSIGAASGATATIAQANQLGANFYAAASTVFNTLYPTTLSDSAFINQLYINLGGLPADGAGSNFWVNRLNFLETQTPDSQVARAQVAAEIAFTLQTFDPNATGDAKIRAETYQNKILVSETLVNTGNPVFNPVSQSLSDPAYLGATNILVGITDTAASVAVAQAQIAAANAANNPALLVGQQLPLTLTILDDTPPEFATSFDNAVFTANPGQNVLGPSNTLNFGDNLQDTGTNGTLNYTAVASLLGNPALAAGVTMNGIVNANILNTSFGVAGFSGNVTGLTNVSVLAGSVGSVLLGLPGAGLNTALETISINASEDFTAWMTNTALASNADAVALILNGVSDNFDPDDTDIDLNVTAGTNAYEELNITSTGGTLNELDIDTNGDTTALITVDGAQDLTLLGTSSVLDLANLETFDGTQAEGNLTVTFNGTGDVVVDGGSGDDDFTFPAGAGAVTVRGNAGNDVFTFLAGNNNPTTFGPEDLADGGAGENRLRLQADQGVLLAAGVGASILNIGTIEHITVGAFSGNLSVNMAESGSATTLDLAGNYGNNFNVTVTNLTNADTVIYSGTNLGNNALFNFLTLTTASPVGVINLVMAASPGSPDDGGTHTIFDLQITQGSLLNIESTGEAALNFIGTGDFVSNVNDVSITGDVDFSWGSVIAYNQEGGVIDASTFEGDLTLFVGGGRQTVIAGLGEDTINVLGAGGTNIDLIELGNGSSDTVSFNAEFFNANLALNNVNYHLVSNFDIDDTIALDVPAIPLDTTLDTAVTFGNAPNIFSYSNGTVLANATTSAFNLIKVSGTVSVGGGTAQDGFNAAFGALGSIDVADAVDNVLFAYYDTTSSQMVIGTATSGVGLFGGVINAGDDFDVVSIVGMTQEEYNTFGTGNLAFV